MAKIGKRTWIMEIHPAVRVTRAAPQKFAP